MTNYCQNHLKIKGSAKDIAAFALTCLTDAELSSGLSSQFFLDFAKILPVPPDLDRSEAENWQFEHWEVQPNRVDYDAAKLTKTRYDASFSSPYGSPEAIILAIARQHPRLAIRFVGVEEGNAYCFELDSRDGMIESGNSELTDGLIEEVEGKGAIEARTSAERAWWGQPSELKKRRIRHFRHWWNEARLKRALSNYPIYVPPNKGLAALMPAAKAEENFAYFQNQKEARIASLRALLGKFGIRLDFDKPAKKKLDRWLHRYGGLLYVEETRPSFYTHNPAWEGTRRSLNVILDLGIYLGEFAIRETPGLSWGLELANPPKRGLVYENFQRPALVSPVAYPGFFDRDVLRHLYRFCNAHCNQSYFLRRGGLIHNSRREARVFFSTTLRDIHLRARGDGDRADKEARERLLGR